MITGQTLDSMRFHLPFSIMATYHYAGSCSFLTHGAPLPSLISVDVTEYVADAFDKVILPSINADSPLNSKLDACLYL